MNYTSEQMCTTVEFAESYFREKNCPEHAERLKAASQFILAAAKPIDMVLRCPSCHHVHLDIGEWALTPHRTHLCENTEDGYKTGCGHLWRPSNHSTRGVYQETIDENRHALNKETI